LFRLLVIENAEEEVDPDDPERFLLIHVSLVQHPHVDHDLARLAPRVALETDAEPAVRFVVLLETARRYGVGKDEECPDASELFVEPLDEQAVFMIEHGLEPVAADITLGRSIDRIAKCHVVGRHRLGDRSGCAADMEKSARHFLARANFGERPILLPIEIDLERLSVGPDIHLRLHTNTVAAVYDRRKRARF
ncbi:MAG: hypothetical protein QOE81_1991, partial [Verrucomicrobiota bacterium]